MKIRKSVAILWKRKMGGCEHRYLAMTRAAPVRSKIGFERTAQKGETGGSFRSRSARDPERKDYLLPKL